MKGKWSAEDDQKRADAMARRWADAQRQAKNRPYVQMQAAGDERDEPVCVALDMIVARIDDPWLIAHLPPHCSRCRCTFITLSDSQLARKGLKLTPQHKLPT